MGKNVLVFAAATVLVVLAGCGSGGSAPNQVTTGSSDASATPGGFSLTNLNDTRAWALAKLEHLAQSDKNNDELPATDMARERRTRRFAKEMSSFLGKRVRWQFEVIDVKKDAERPSVQVKEIWSNSWSRGPQEEVTRRFLVSRQGAGQWGDWIIGSQISREFADRFPGDDFIVVEGVMKDIQLTTNVLYLTSKVELTYRIEVVLGDAHVVETGRFD